MAVLEQISSRLADYMRLGTDRRRWLFERSRAMLHHRTCTARRRVARELAGGANFVIPRDRGFAVLGPGCFEQAAAVVAEARRCVSGLDPTQVRQPQVTTHGVFVHLVKPHEITIGSPYLAFILRPDVIAAIASYLGMVPVLAQVDVWYSRHSPEINNSQLYHCDWSATRQVKVFLYASDVAVENGPLTVVEARHSRVVRAVLKYDHNRCGRRYRVSDEQMQHLGAAGRTHVLTGPSETSCFVDTGQCFHYGSRIAAGAAARIMVLFQLLIPGACQLPLQFEKGAPFRRLAYPNLPEYQRLVLGGS